MIKFYQVKDTRNGSFATPEEAKQNFLYGGFDCVATVNADKLDNAWFLTNSIESYWAENPEVTVLDDGLLITEERGGLRSAMTGDIYELNGELYLIADMGFEKI